MDLVVEQEIESINAGLEPIEEKDAVDVLAAWRQTRTAMTHEILTRGLHPTGVVKPGNTVETYNNASKQDLVRLGGTVAKLGISAGTVQK